MDWNNDPSCMFEEKFISHYLFRSCILDFLQGEYRQKAKRSFIFQFQWGIYSLFQLCKAISACYACMSNNCSPADGALNRFYFSL